MNGTFKELVLDRSYMTELIDITGIEMSVGDNFIATESLYDPETKKKTGNYRKMEYKIISDSPEGLKDHIEVEVISDNLEYFYVNDWNWKSF